MGPSERVQAPTYRGDNTTWVSIDWGVYGVPETFVIDGNGRIVYKHIGPITPRDREEKMAPLIEQLRK